MKDKILAALLLAAFGPLTAYAVPIVNGGLEDGPFVSTAANYMLLNPGDTALSGWTIDQTVVWGVNPTDGFTASQGDGFVDLSSFGSASTTGQISQIAATIIGAIYEFSIDRQGFGSTVSLGGNDLALAAGATNGSWTTFTGTFTATSTNTTVSVRNTSGGNAIVFIDEIILREVSRPPITVPEPGILLLFGLGLLAMRFTIRKFT